MNDTTILIVGHGSREESGNAEIREFLSLWRARRPGWRIEACFIEFAPPSLHDGLLAAGRNSRRVLVLPLILNAAGHVKMEIPEAIEHAREHCPGVSFQYAPHLTACEPVLEILNRRLRGAMQELDMPDPTTTGVILLGRGSSDRGANGDMARMARWLQEAGDHELVELAFTGITWPRLERVVQRQSLIGMRQIVVLPYYLFTGTLIQRIERQMAHLAQQYPQVRFAQGHYFGFQPEVFALLDQRVAELRSDGAVAALPCDGCKYRQLAEDSGLGVHHHHEAGHAHDHGHDHGHVHVAASSNGHDGAPGHAHAHDHDHSHDHHDHDHDHAHAH